MAVSVADQPVAGVGVTPSSIWNSYCSGVSPCSCTSRRPSEMRNSSWVAIPTYDPARSSSSRLRTKFCAHLVVALVRDERRLDVDALAEAHVRCVRRQLADVPDRPAEVGLQDDADVVEPGLAQLAVQRSVSLVQLESSMSIRTKLPLSAAWRTTVSRFARQSSYARFRPSAVSFTLTFESSCSRSIASKTSW